jgi:hypothetical protein
VKFFICTDLVFEGTRRRKHAMTDKFLCREKKTVLNGTLLMCLRYTWNLLLVRMRKTGMLKSYQTLPADM